MGWRPLGLVFVGGSGKRCVFKSVSAGLRTSFTGCEKNAATSSLPVTSPFFAAFSLFYLFPNYDATQGRLPALFFFNSWITWMTDRGGVTFRAGRCGNSCASVRVPSHQSEARRGLPLPKSQPSVRFRAPDLRVLVGDLVVRPGVRPGAAGGSGPPEVRGQTKGEMEAA